MSSVNMASVNIAALVLRFVVGEYVLMITLVSGALGAGSWSVDRAVGFGVHGWAGLAITAVAGVGGAALLLATSWRPRPAASPASSGSAPAPVSASSAEGTP